MSEKIENDSSVSYQAVQEVCHSRMSYLSPCAGLGIWWISDPQNNKIRQSNHGFSLVLANDNRLLKKSQLTDQPQS